MNKSPTPVKTQSLFLETLQDTRRQFIRKAGGLTMSAAAVTLMAGTSTSVLAGDSGNHEKMVEQDLQILNAAIAAEHQAVAAYQLGAESGLLEPGVLKVAVAFQGHHKAHIAALDGAVKSLGGTPVDALSEYDFPVEKLKAQSDVLEFAAGLERGAMSAYAGAIPAFDNRDLSAAAASILADEAMHWAVLRSVLGLTPVVPGAFFS